jgi:hypothetical protein
LLQAAESADPSHRGSIFGANFSEGVMGDVPDYFLLPIENAWSSSKSVNCNGDFLGHQQNNQVLNKEFNS